MSFSFSFLFPPNLLTAYGSNQGHNTICSSVAQGSRKSKMSTSSHSHTLKAVATHTRTKENSFCEPCIFALTITYRMKVDSIDCINVIVISVALEGEILSLLRLIDMLNCNPTFDRTHLQDKIMCWANVQTKAMLKLPPLSIEVL